jgi:hypothetical protein
MSANKLFYTSVMSADHEVISVMSADNTTKIFMLADHVVISLMSADNTAHFYVS